MFAAISGALALTSHKGFDINGVSTSESSLHPAAVKATSTLTSNSFGLGVANGCIPDEAFTASTTRKIAGADFSPHRARLGLESESAVDAGWSPAHSDHDPYLTVDLGGKFELSSLITQGGYKLDPQTSAAQPAWVSQYKVETSLDGASFDVMEGRLEGNNDAHTPALRELSLLSHERIIARYVRIRPLKCAVGASSDGRTEADEEPVTASKHPEHCSLRMEVLGRTPCKHNKCEKPLPLGAAVGGLLPDASFTASSRASSSTPPHSARLHMKPKAFQEGGWSPGDCPFGWNHEDCARAPPYLQVDLQASRIINAVATQGSASRPSWVSAYQLAFSNDGREWARLEQPLRGNSDAFQVVKNPLPKPVLARYVRFVPLQWHGTGNDESSSPCKKDSGCGGGSEAAETFGLRVEVFGPEGYRPGELGCRLQTKSAGGLGSSSVASLASLMGVGAGETVHCPCGSSAGGGKRNKKAGGGFFVPMVLQPTASSGEVGEERKDKHQCGCGRHIPSLLRGSPLDEEEEVVAGGLPAEVMRKPEHHKPENNDGPKFTLAKIAKGTAATSLAKEVSSKLHKVATVTVPAGQLKKAGNGTTTPAAGAPPAAAAKKPQQGAAGAPAAPAAAAGGAPPKAPAAPAPAAPAKK